MKIRRPSRMLAVAAVAGAGVLVGCSAAPPPPAAPEAPAASTSPAASYRNEQSGFALTPPPGWQQVPGLAVSAATFVAPNRASGGNTTVVNMNVVVTPTDADLDANLAGAKQLLPESFPDYRPVVDEALTLADGQPAHLLGCTFTQSGSTLRNLQLLVVARGNAYVVSGTAPDLTFATYEPAIRQSLSTFALI
jgi:hypothetical protein